MTLNNNKNILNKNLLQKKINYVRLFHSTVICMVDNNNLEGSSDNVPPVDAEKLLNNLEELYNSSDQMSVSEYLIETFSSYEEAFPKLAKEERIKKLLASGDLEHIDKIFNNGLLNKESLQMLAAQVHTSPGSSLLDKTINFSLTSRGHLKGNLNAELLDSLNTQYNKVVTPNSSETGNLIELTEDWKLIFDIKKLNLLADNCSEAIKQLQLDNVNVNVVYTGFLSLTLVRFYLKMAEKYTHNTKIQLSNVNKADQLLLQKNIIKNKTIYFTASTIILTGSLLYLFNLAGPNKVGVTVNNPESSKNITKSLIFFTTIKNNK